MATEAIRVCVRLKPLSQEPSYPDVESVISVDGEGQSITISSPSEWVTKYVSCEAEDGRRSSSARRLSNGRKSPGAGKRSGIVPPPKTPTSRRHMMEMAGIEEDDGEGDKTIFLGESVDVADLPWVATPTQTETPHRAFKTVVNTLDSPSVLPPPADLCVTEAPQDPAPGTPARGGRTPARSATPVRSTTPKRARTPSRCRSASPSVASGRMSAGRPSSRATDAPKQFTYDRVFGESSTQSDVFNEVAPFVDAVMSGYNATVFVYGATGAGKTYTMVGGDGSAEGDQSLPARAGMIPRTLRHIFERIGADGDAHEYFVKLTVVEIYKDKIIDLLDPQNNRDLRMTAAEKEQKNRTKVEVREDTRTKTVYLSGSDYLYTPVETYEQAVGLIARGLKQRRTNSTNCNAKSSRSHAVITVTVESHATSSAGKSTQVAKINLIDLAGSERLDKSGAEGEALKEATKINASLTALSNVLADLSNPNHKGPIPYRNSKLTRLLQDSLGGNAKTLFIVNASADASNYRESLLSLQYGARAKKIRNTARKNRVDESASTAALQEEIKRLEELLTGQKEEISRLTRANVELETAKHTASQEKLDELQEKLDDVYTRGVNEKLELEQEYERYKDEASMQQLLEKWRSSMVALAHIGTKKELLDMRVEQNHTVHSMLVEKIEMHQLRDALATAAADQQALQADVVQVQADLAKAEETLAEKSATLESVEATAGESEEVVKDLEKKVHALKHELEKAQNVEVSLQSNIETLEAELKRAGAKKDEENVSHKEFERLRKTNEAQQKRISELEEKLKNLKKKAEGKLKQLAERIQYYEEEYAEEGQDDSRVEDVEPKSEMRPECVEQEEEVEAAATSKVARKATARKSAATTVEEAKPNTAKGGRGRKRSVNAPATTKAGKKGGVRKSRYNPRAATPSDEEAGSEAEVVGGGSPVAHSPPVSTRGRKRKQVNYVDQLEDKTATPVRRSGRSAKSAAPPRKRRRASPVEDDDEEFVAEEAPESPKPAKKVRKPVMKAAVANETPKAAQKPSAAALSKFTEERAEPVAVSTGRKRKLMPVNKNTPVDMSASKITGSSSASTQNSVVKKRKKAVANLIAGTKRSRVTSKANTENLPVTVNQAT